MFKQKYNLDERRSESSRVLSKYPDKIPVICERRASSKMENIDKEKYLVPNDLTVGQFIYVIRKRLHLPPEKAIFLFVNGRIPVISRSIADLYETDKDFDGFLYILYSDENVFGSFI